MGHCTKCGAPCPHCIAATEITYLRLPEKYRDKIRALLEGVGASTNERVSKVISSVVQYDDLVVERAIRIWNSGSFLAEGKDERYFLGILRSVSVAKRVKLDTLPPLIEPEDTATEGEGVE